MGQSKYGVELAKLSAHGQAAVRAAEQLGARTMIQRDQIPVAAIIPADDLDKLDDRDPGEDGTDLLLALCGKCDNDLFVDQFNSELNRTRLFQRTLTRGTPNGQGHSGHAPDSHVPGSQVPGSHIPNRHAPGTQAAGTPSPRGRAPGRPPTRPPPRPPGRPPRGKKV